MVSRWLHTRRCKSSLEDATERNYPNSREVDASPGLTKRPVQWYASKSSFLSFPYNFSISSLGSRGAPFRYLIKLIFSLLSLIR